MRFCKFGAVLVAFFLAVNVNANHLGDNCGYLNVVITNHTKNKCMLAFQHIIHGSLSYSPFPQYVDAGLSSRPTLLYQTVYGPDVRLSYRCGPNKVFVVRAQQNYCLLASGNISTHILEAHGVNVHPYAEMAGNHQRPHGFVEWVVEDAT